MPKNQNNLQSLGLKCAAVFAAGILAMASRAAAEVPQQINHQGVVSVDGLRFDGTGAFRFAIVDPDTGVNLWTNDGTHEGEVGGVPDNAVNQDADPSGLPVTNGVYSVRLGDTDLTNMTPIPPSVFNDDNAVLRIWFDDGANGNQQLTPDHPLTTSPYSFRLPNIKIDDVGRVGIGLETPTELLDVAVNVRARGNLLVGGDAIVDNKLLVNGDATIDNKLKVGASGSATATLHVLHSGPGGRGFLVDDQAATSPLATIQSTQFNDIGTVIFEVVADSDQDSGGPFPVFSVRSNGFIFGLGGVLFHSPSDARLKKDIANIPRALERVLRLRGVNFKWKDARVDGDSLQMGMVAQEVGEVFPEAVHTAKDNMGTKAIEYEHLVAALVEAIKELDGNVRHRDAELVTQRKEIARLETRLRRLETLMHDKVSAHPLYSNPNTEEGAHASGD